VLVFISPKRTLHGVRPLDIQVQLQGTDDSAVEFFIPFAVVIVFGYVLIVAVKAVFF